MFMLEQMDSRAAKGAAPRSPIPRLSGPNSGACDMPHVLAVACPDVAKTALFPMMKQASAAQQDIRFRVLRLLQARPELTQREIARELGVSLGRVNFCLRALVDKGLVKIRNFQNSKNRTAYLYLLTPKGICAKMALTEAFLKRRLAEYRALRAEIQGLAQTLPDPESGWQSE